jgi:hypothetical protein
MRVLVALLSLFASTAAFAGPGGPAAVDRDLTRQELQTIAQQIAIAQQQIDQLPGARVQLAAAIQQLAAAQTQVGELMRQVSVAPPARGYVREHEGEREHGDRDWRDRDYPPPPPPPQVLSPMGDATLRSLVQQINGVPFSSDKLDVLRQAANGNFFLVDQVSRLLPLFVHSADRISALQILAPLILDRPNNFKIIPLFQFSGDRSTAQKILESAPQPLAR